MGSPPGPVREQPTGARRQVQWSRLRRLRPGGRPFAATRYVFDSCGAGLNARVPRPAVGEVALLPTVVELAGDDETREVFQTFVTELPLDAEPQRRAVLDRQIAA